MVHHKRRLDRLFRLNRLEHATMNLTHLDSDGQPHQVNVSGKPVTARQATARGLVQLPAVCREVLAQGGDTAKGNVLTIARLAAIGGAKRTSDLIPLCHQVPLDGVDCECEVTPDGVAITATARCHARTGVEMEALTAVSVAALTIYDMLKALSHDIVIHGIELVSKDGGRSGSIRRN